MLYLLNGISQGQGHTLSAEAQTRGLDLADVNTRKHLTVE